MSERRGRGRPKLDTEAVNVRLHRETISKLDELREAEEDHPSRPEMVRRLLDFAMKHWKRD